MTRTVTAGTGSTRRVSPAGFADTSVTLAAGAQSRELLQAAQSGATLPTATLTLAGGAGKNAGHVYELDGVLLSSIEDAATGQAADAPLETITPPRPSASSRLTGTAPVAGI